MKLLTIIDEPNCIELPAIKNALENDLIIKVVTKELFLFHHFISSDFVYFAYSGKTISQLMLLKNFFKNNLRKTKIICLINYPNIKDRHWVCLNKLGESVLNSIIIYDKKFLPIIEEKAPIFRGRISIIDEKNMNNIISKYRTIFKEIEILWDKWINI